MRRTLLASPRLADDLLERWLDATTTPTAPTRRLDMRETAEEYGVRLELPGFTPDEVSVELTGDVLTIRAATAEAKADDGASTTTDGWPRPAERLSRAVRFEKPIDASRVEAELTHGVLRVRLPKSEAARPRRITVRSAAEPVPTTVTPTLEHRPEQAPGA